MRGDQEPQAPLFATIVLEDRIPADHPLRAVRALVDPILRELSSRFDTLYSERGRPSIPPELLLRALLLQRLYTIRSERQLVEQLEYDLLFRWFVGLDLDAPAWHATTFTKNRDRLLEGDVARAFLSEVVALARRQGLLSSAHFTVDGTLMEASASHKSVRAKDDDADTPIDPQNQGVDFHGQSRSNATHQSASASGWRETSATVHQQRAGRRCPGALTRPSPPNVNLRLTLWCQEYQGVPPPLSRLPLPMIRSFVPCIHVGSTRNWSPSATVALNPPCQSDGGAAPSPLRRPSA
jgi:transposase